MAASSSSFFPRKARHAQPAGQRPPLDERKARAEDTDPGADPKLEDDDEDDIDDRFPWFGPDYDALESDLLEDWDDGDDPSLVPFLPDEDELDADEDEDPDARHPPR